MSVFLNVTQCVIFGSYFVISCIVAYVFVRHRKYVDTCTNRLLLVTAGLFLMLCALTHLHSLWSTDEPEVLLFLCALASFVSAVCFSCSFRNLDDYLKLRVATKDVMREEIVMNLTKGYVLKVVAEGNTITSGVAGSLEVSEPIAVDGGFEVGGIVKVGESHFRVANIVESFVSLDGDDTGEHGRLSSPKSTMTKHVYGHDASAEVRMRDESDRMNRMKMDLCMLTAHHVKTPLSCLGVALADLQPRLRSKECVQLLNEAIVHCEIMNMVTTQFVDIATVDLAMTLRPCMDYVDIRSLSERVRRVLCRIQMEAVRCTCTVGENVPRFVLTDGAWVMQIMLNLVANAARYTLHGSISVKVNLGSSVLSIVVRDTGVGVPDSAKRGVIDKDWLMDATGGHGSTGIGLHSVKMKVGALRGEYMICDNPGGGTVLSVRIPVRIDNRCYGRDLSGGAGDEEDVNVTLVRSILLVDDTPSVRKLMQRHMRDHRVMVAVNGLDGLRMMKERKFDVVFLDMMMPVMDGAECLQEFRKWETCNRSVGDRQLVYCMSATSVELGTGFDGSIPKPVDTKRLKVFLKNLP